MANEKIDGVYLHCKTCTSKFFTEGYNPERLEIAVRGQIVQVWCNGCDQEVALFNTVTEAAPVECRTDINDEVADLVRKMQDLKEKWLQEQCDKSGMTPEVLAKHFVLQESEPILDASSSKIRMDLKLVPRSLADGRS